MAASPALATALYGADEHGVIYSYRFAGAQGGLLGMNVGGTPFGQHPIDSGGCWPSSPLSRWAWRSWRCAAWGRAAEIDVAPQQAGHIHSRVMSSGHDADS